MCAQMPRIGQSEWLICRMILNGEKIFLSYVTFSRHQKILRKVFLVYTLNWVKNLQLLFLSQNLFFSSSCSLEITSEIGFESFSFFTTKSCWKVFMPWLILLFKLLYDALMATRKSKDWKWILGREIQRNEFS